MSTEVTAVPEGAQALAPRETGGVMALALMTEQEFEARLITLKKGQDRLRRIQRELMEPDEDYGQIPGTDRPTLYKPGAEKLCAIYSLVPTYEDRWIEGDGHTTPHLRVQMKCFLRKGSEDGPLVAVGVGAANSWERKHRYRSQKRSCPACGAEGTIRKSKFPDKKTGDIGWWCKDENCKANFRGDDPAIIGQVAGTVDNPDPYDVENTLFKMAKKRSYVDATLNATATSGLFAQDLEDMVEDERPAAQQPQRPPAPAPQPAQGREPGSDDDPAEVDPQAAYERHGVEPPQPRQQAAAPGPRPACPACQTPKTVIKNKYPKKGATWYCLPSSGGCGAKFDA